MESPQPPSEELAAEVVSFEAFLSSLEQGRVRGIPINDTVIFSHGVCRGLYWYERSSQTIIYDAKWPHVEAQQTSKMFTTKRTADSVIRNELIVKRLSSAGQSLGCADNKHMEKRDVPCCVWIREIGRDVKTGTASVAISFLNSTELHLLLESANESFSGLVVAYRPPVNGKHNLVRAIFTPYLTKVEKHECLADVMDENISIELRTRTSYGSQCTTSPITKELTQSIDTLCESIYRSFEARHDKLRQGIFYLMQLDTSTVVFLWATKLDARPFQEDDHLHGEGAGPRAATGGRKTEQKQEFAARSPASSPVREADQTDQSIELFSTVQHFGFWGDEPRRIKNSLKRQIQTLAIVTPPPSLELDDAPPYSDQFIRALVDPRFGDRYFKRKHRGGFNATPSGGQESGMAALKRQGSLASMVSANFDDAVAQLSRDMSARKGFRGKRPASPSNRRSSLSLQSQSQSYSRLDVSPIAHPAKVPQQHSAMPELTVTDAENMNTTTSFDKQSVTHSEGTSVTTTQAHLAGGNSDIIDRNRFHEGRIVGLRRKYSQQQAQQLAHEEQHSAFNRRVYNRSVVKAAQSFVDRIRHKARDSTLQEVAEARAASKALMVEMGFSPEKSPSTSNSKLLRKASNRTPWLDVNHRDYAQEELKKALQKENVSVRRCQAANAMKSFVGKEIPQYQSMLAEGSLMSYLVGTENFEHRPSSRQRPLSSHEISSTAEIPRIQSDMAVPDAPVVMAGNTHLSISEEALQRNKARGFASRDLLEMLFHEEPKSSVGGDADERARELQQDDLLVHQAQQREEERQRLAQADAQRLQAQHDTRAKLVLQTQYGAQQAHEQVQAVVFAFEDLLYQQRSVSLQSRAGKQTQEIVITIPKTMANRRRELHSLFLVVGFSCRPIESDGSQWTQRPYSGEQHGGGDDEEGLEYQEDWESDDEDPDEGSEFHTIRALEYVIPNDSVAIARAEAKVKQYARDVAELYANEDWIKLGKVKQLVETGGYTLVDAIQSVKKDGRPAGTSQPSVFRRVSSSMPGAMIDAQ